MKEYGARFFDILAACPALTNGGLHNLMCTRHLYDWTILELWCVQCHEHGTFSSKEYDRYELERETRFAAAKRRRTSGRR